MQKLVELILADEGFEIKATTNGEEALAAISSFKPHIVLADIEMPKINGYQLCEKMKQDSSTSNIPVILLAGAFESFDESLAKQVKANDFIVKPFESQELLSKIHASLKDTAVTEEEVIVVTEAPGKEEVAEEDLWAMEEILDTEGVEVLPAEEKAEVEKEEVAEEVVAVEEVPVEAPEPEVEEAVPAEKAEILEVELPSKDELKDIFEKTVNEKISSLLSTINIKGVLLDSLMPLMKDYLKETIPDLSERMFKEALEGPLKSLPEDITKITDKIASDLTEKISKEMSEGSLANLTKEVEKVIWKTVPDIAERIISKEIERIRSEF